MRRYKSNFEIYGYLFFVFAFVVGCSGFKGAESKVNEVAIQSAAQSSLSPMFCKVSPDPIPVRDMLAVDRLGFDAQILPIEVNGKKEWLSHGFSGVHRTRGTVNRPFEASLWTFPKDPNDLYSTGRQKAEVFVNTKKYLRSLWITNLYQNEKGILAFVHVEAWDPSDDTKWVGRVGLAWSTNGGESFTYLGHIIQPFGAEPMTRDNGNVQGVPYIVRPENPALPVSDSNPEYFYIYFQERTYGYAVGAARAKVSDVIEAAVLGRSTPWNKFYNGSWTSSGMGGPATVTNLSGVTHTDGAYSPASKKSYLVLTFPKGLDPANTNTRVELYDSNDMIKWNLKSEIVTEPASDLLKPGYQYATLVDPDSRYKNGQTRNGRLHLYVIKDYLDPAQSVTRRWDIEADLPAKPCEANTSVPSGSLSGNFSVGGVGFFSNGKAYCQHSAKSDVSFLTKVENIPLSIENHGVCGDNPTSGTFKVGEEYFYSNGAGYCVKEFHPRAESVGLELAANPYRSTSLGKCNMGSIPPGHFLFKGKKFYSNGQAYCAIAKNNSVTVDYFSTSIPESMVDHGVCGPPIPEGVFSVGGFTYYSNGSAFCRLRNAASSSNIYLAVPTLMPYHGVCHGG